MYRDLLIRVLPPTILYVWIGWWCGGKIVAIPNVQFFKVLNVLGLTFDLAGILVLSHFVMSSVRLQKFIATDFTDHILWFLICANVGLFAYSSFGNDGPSKVALEGMAIGLLFALVTPLINIVGTFITGIDTPLAWPNDVRCRLLGILLVIYGVLIQIYAAILDLYS